MAGRSPIVGKPVDFVEPSIDGAYRIAAARCSLVIAEDNDRCAAEGVLEPITDRPVTSPAP